jgi:hypothetical protein
MRGRMGGMATKNDIKVPRAQIGDRAVLILIAVVIFSAALILAYWAAYKVMGSRATAPTDDHVVFAHKWQARLFWPAGQADAAIQKKRVHIGWNTRQ